MKNKKLLLLGFDGMDFDLTQSMLDILPNFRKLAAEGTFKPFRSVFPPDSIPSWVTAYTGLDPSEHGILESVNYLAKGDDRLKVDNSAFKGKTFWDELSRGGRSVCVINPFLAYPVWPVNGVMINGPVFIGGDIQVSAQGSVSGLNIPDSIGGIADFPTRKNLGEFIAKTISDTREQAAFGLAMLQQSEPDLFFQTFLTTDRIQHFLWRYCDPNDPTWPGKSRFSSVIKDFYVETDRILGEFLKAMGPDYQLLVISDHGHGMRCTHCFNINEYLRKKGLVVSLAADKKISKKIILEKLKNRFLKFMNDHDLEDYISLVAKFVPNAKEMKKGKLITDSSKNRAYASDFTGTNPFGGICINKEMPGDSAVLIEELIEEFTTLHHEGTPVFQWIKRREEMFSGMFLERFPDILFEMNASFGVNWALYTDLFTVNPTHKKVSGGHRNNGVLFYSNDLNNCNDFAMIDLYPTLLDYFNIPLPEIRSGKSWLNDPSKMDKF